MITAIISAISGAFKIVSQLLGMAKDKELRDEGAIAQQRSDLAAEVKAQQDALKAANTTDSKSVADSLRNGDF